MNWLLLGGVGGEQGANVLIVGQGRGAELEFLRIGQKGGGDKGKKGLKKLAAPIRGGMFLLLRCFVPWNLEGGRGEE